MSFPNKRSKLFFFLTRCPVFLQWIYFWFLARSNNPRTLTVIIPIFMYWCWADRIIPVTSIYELDKKWDYLDYDLLDMYYDNKELPRRSDSSGYCVCHVTFLLTEAVLFIAPIASGMVLLFHACSVYYWILGLLHVRYYETLQHDEVYYRVIAAMEEFRKKSIFGFFAMRRVRGSGRPPFYPIITVVFWVVGILIAYAEILIAYFVK